MSLLEKTDEEILNDIFPVKANMVDGYTSTEGSESGVAADQLHQNNLDSSRSPAEAADASRIFDYLMITTIFFILAGAYQLHANLTMGDWDFWVDWKDRRLWTTVTPITLLVFPVVVQAVLWQRFRLPLGATMCALALLSGEWISRYSNFYGLFNFPISMVFPSMIIPGALLLDLTLLLSRRFLITGTIGAICWALIFYPGNWPIIAPFHVPVEYNGMMLSIADIMGYNYVRSAAPEYLRNIEKGSLNTFGKDVVPVSAVFSAAVCMWIYLIWHFIGRFFGSTKFLFSSRPQPEDGLLEMGKSEHVWGIGKMILMVGGTLIFPIIGLVIWASYEGIKNRIKSRILLSISIIMFVELIFYSTTILPLKIPL